MLALSGWIAQTAGRASMNRLHRHRYLRHRYLLHRYLLHRYLLHRRSHPRHPLHRLCSVSSPVIMVQMIQLAMEFVTMAGQEQNSILAVSGWIAQTAGCASMNHIQMGRILAVMNIPGCRPPFLHRPYSLFAATPYPITNETCHTWHEQSVGSNRQCEYSDGECKAGPPCV